MASKTNLFQSGVFKLASGKKSSIKIEMDALTPDDWETLAMIAATKVLPPFNKVYGVPTGGLPFADALRSYESPSANVRVICDDVLTTGGSIEKFQLTLPHAPALTEYGVVVFARGKCPWWVSPLFQAGWS